MATRVRMVAAMALAGLALVLSGCAAPRMIDSDVQSFVSGETPQRPALYRFERLPSQASAPESAQAQDALEALTTAALAKVGLTPAPLVSGAISGTAAAAPTARYAVQVSAQVSAMVSPYSAAFGGDYWWRQGRYRGGLGLVMEPSWFRHAVHIVLRDSASSRVVYETSAQFDGPWSDSTNLLPVILDAALRDYPNPPSGVRKVVIELPAPGGEAR
jgi:hypothetical protein